jgi:TetR/AcrR family transcriptional regulator, transcriptional repressor for nem operon
MKNDDAVTDSFLDYLEMRLAAQKSLPKRERTRERLRIAAVQVLNERGYEDMRTLTITEQAGLSEGLFYVYFKSKVDITLSVLSEFHLGYLEQNAPSRSQASAFQVIQAANRRWIEVACANPGIMRCIFQAGNEVPEFATLISKINKQWYGRVLHSVQRRKPETGNKASMLPLYMLGGMMDELIRKLVVYPDPEFLAVIEESGSDHDAIADAATMIWYRVLYLDDDFPEGVSNNAQLLAGHFQT